MKRWQRGLLSSVGGIVVAFAVWVYLHEESKKIEAQSTMVTVVYAKRYIPAGREVKESFLEEKKLPLAYVEPGAYRDVNEIKEGKLRSRIGILKGEQVTRSKLLSDRSALGLSWIVPAGLVASSLRLPPEDAVAGLLRPGDWVHLYPLFERVQILAVNNLIWGGEQKNESEADLGLLVTFGLTPDEGAKLARVKQKEHLSIALISNLDVQ